MEEYLLAGLNQQIDGGLHPAGETDKDEQQSKEDNTRNDADHKPKGVGVEHSSAFPAPGLIHKEWVCIANIHQLHLDVAGRVVVAVDDCGVIPMQ